MYIFCIVLGVILFLLMEHSLIFWLLFLPLAVIFLVSSYLWVTGKGFSVTTILISVVTLLGMVLVVMFSASTEKCEHQVVTRYFFSTDDSTMHHSACRYCTKCDTRLTEHSLFQGELVDKSYLEAIKEHSDGSEIIPGEYYTVTATVPLGFIGTCEVENEDFIVRFDVDFRDEFVLDDPLENGTEITFRGRFYDKGCGFTDAELISINNKE